MNTTNISGQPGAGDRLDLPACPICQTQTPPSRQQATIGGKEYVWYECAACRSALMSLGGGRWAFQKITRPEHEHLLRKPMTLLELGRLLPAAQPPPAVTLYHEAPPSSAWTPAPPAPSPRVEEAPAWPTPPPGPSTPVERARSEPEPVVPIEREATSIEALRATLIKEEEVPEPVVARADTPRAARALPSPFVIAVVVLVVLLLVGLALIAAVVLSLP